MTAANLVLKNANVITMDAGQPTAEVVAITGDRILLVTSNAEIDSVVGARTKVIDCFMSSSIISYRLSIIN